MKLTSIFLILSLSTILLLQINSVESKRHQRLTKQTKEIPSSSIKSVASEAEQTLLKSLNEKHHQVQVQKKSVLSITPKGINLKNHFGAEPQSSPYGPQPTLLQKNATIQNADGTTQNIVLTKIIHTSVIKDQCDISTFRDFQVCLKFNDNCDICSALPQCGWCEQTKRCLPGSAKEAACPGACSLSGWNFKTSSCGVKSVYGKGKMSHDATGLINPELTDPKAKVQTVLSHEAVVKTPVLLGYKKYRHNHIKRDQAGQVIGQQSINIDKPIIGEVHQVMNVQTHHKQYIDIKTGKRLDKVDPDAFHGKDNY